MSTQATIIFCVAIGAFSIAACWAVGTLAATIDRERRARQDDRVYMGNLISELTVQAHRHEDELITALLAAAAPTAALANAQARAAVAGATQNGAETRAARDFLRAQSRPFVENGEVIEPVGAG